MGGGGKGSPAGEPGCQCPAHKDQYTTPGGERQPAAEEQRAASQTFPPLPPPPPAVQTPPCPPCSRLLRQQQEQGKSTMHQARSSDPGLSSKDLTPWGRAPALTVVCAALLALSPKHNPPLTSPSPSPSPPLPLKKRPTPQ